MLNPYEPPDRETSVEPAKARKIAKGGFFASLCFAIGSISLPVGLVLIHTFVFSSYLSDYAATGLPAGIITVVAAVGFLMLGTMRVRQRSRVANAKRAD